MGVKPQKVVDLTFNQLNELEDLLASKKDSGGIIIGSISKDRKLHLSFIPQEIAIQLIKFAEAHKDDLELKGDTNGRN